MLWVAGHHDQLLQSDSFLSSNHRDFQPSPRAHQGYLQAFFCLSFLFREFELTVKQKNYGISLFLEQKSVQITS